MVSRTLCRTLSWLMHVPDDRRLVFVLILVDVLGAIYGFNWYAVQLSHTNPVFWPIVPDSPLSTLLFGLMLIVLFSGRRSGPLEGISYVSMVKYGVWTPVIFIQAWATRGYAYWEEVFLSASHMGMALQALLFYRVFAPARNYLLAAGAWSLFNDYMDYARGFHPYLPFDRHLPSISVYTPALTVLTVTAFVLARKYSDQGTAWFRKAGCRRP